MLRETVISLLAGVLFSPHATNFIKPVQYAQDDPENLVYITLYFSRLVLGVQLVLAGVQLPSRYLWKQRKPLLLLLGPGMIAMWISSSLLIWGMVPNLPFLHALACGACVTPTDPVLSNTIVKGKFADKNVPKDLQKIIIAESGANDGLGYPFLFLALYLLKYVEHGGLGQPGGASKAMAYWFGETLAYTIILSVVYGITVGWIAKELLHFAEERKWVDRESFLVFAITLALFIVGTVGMIGSDDVLACFVAGNAFTWDDWFRLETLDDSLQPTIDMLLNLSIFMWYGAVCPWASFRVNDVIPIYRLIFLGVLILLFRRIPYILTIHKFIPQIEQFQQAAFVGFFGPIGVSAIFYLYISIDFLEQTVYQGEEREDARRLQDTMMVVIWFLAICSIVVHGLSIPLGKVGYHLPRTVSSAFSQSLEIDDPQPFHLREAIRNARTREQGAARRRRGSPDSPPRTVFRIGRSNIRSPTGNQTPTDEPQRPVNYPDQPNDPPQLPIEPTSRVSMASYDMAQKDRNSSEVAVDGELQAGAKEQPVNGGTTPREGH
ncbi:MAG: hypothetical protein Q9227_008734 [Pyrenula ochraceoflavens]